MKILWVSDAPSCPSGYGNQTALFVPRLRATGHEVSVLATSQGVAQRLPDGTLVLPVFSDKHGNSAVAAHAAALGVDLVISLMDPVVLDPNVYKDLPWCAWAPLDFETPPKALLRSLKAAKWVWSPSKHGADAYRKTGLKNVAHVPHGVDSSVFDIADRASSRQALSASLGREIADDAFLAVAVGANRGTPSRKGFYELLTAWKRFTDNHQDALLYLHTEPTGLGGIGEDLYDVMELIDLPNDRVIFPPRYHYLCGALGPEHLATAYAAANVFVSASHGEGFGIPALEAQMCGCSVILPDNTAQTEMLITGRLVETTQYMPFDGATTWRRPIIETFVDALEEAHRDRPRHTDEPADTRDRALAFDIDRVFNERMLPELKKIEEELK